jgi:hypothetical protein
VIYHWNPDTEALYVTIPRESTSGPLSTKVIDEVTELDYFGSVVVGVQINDVSKRWKMHPQVIKEVGHFRANLIFDRVELMVRNQIVPQNRM